MAHVNNPFVPHEEDLEQPSTSANNGGSKKKAESVKRAKKVQKKKNLPLKNPFTEHSDSDSDTKSAAAPAVKQKKIAALPDSDDELSQEPIRAATLRSAFSQRVASGYSYQSDPGKTGQYFFELRVYNTREAERLQYNERWKQALITLKLATDQNTGVWAALTGLINAGRNEMKEIRPVLYSNPQYL